MAGSGFGRRGKGTEADGVALFFEKLDLELGVFEACFAHFEQATAVFKLRHQFGQGHIARLHRFHDRFELGEGVLEGQLRELLFGHSGSMWAAKRRFQ